MKLSALCLLVLFLALGAAAQVRKLEEGKGIQTYLNLDNPLSEQEAINSFVKKCGLGRGNNFESKAVNKDKVGNTHERYQQFFNGIKVEFGTVITHSNNEGVFAVNGEIYNAANLNLLPNLTKPEALQIIIASKQGATFMWDNPEEAALMQYAKPEGELVILPNVRTGQINLAYKFDVYTTTPIGRDYIYVDAHNGAILLTNAIIKHANELNAKKNAAPVVSSHKAVVAGNADTKYSGTRSIETTFDTALSRYVLLDGTRGGGIVTYNNQRRTVYQNVHFTDLDNNWTSAEFNNANKDIGALDAHWGAMKTYDFWFNNFGRSSYDGLGTRLVSYVHYRKVANQSLVNAFWNGTAMSYGDGNTSVGILTSLDVCGHEIGHGVCSSTADLVYQNQSGAINEGFSDIWGACIEHYGRTGALTGTPAVAVWTIAEDLSSTPFRSMKTPLTFGDPDTYLGTNWTATGDEGSCAPISTNDYCGVHTNSGVLNHWFYILTMGKSATNNAPSPDTYSVTGIGMTKSSEIAFLAERDYLTPNATYFDVRQATLSAASTLYCSNSPEYIALTNAWYAVNVGEQYVNYPNDVALKRVNFTPSVSCGANNNPVLVFENAGTNTISSVTVNYAIDGGAPVSSIWTGSLGTCQTVNYPITIGALSRGTHSIVITSTIASDGNATNNSKTILVTVNDSGTANQINTFETASNVLVSYDDGGTNTLWQRGLASGATLTSAVAQNSNVYGTILNGVYPNETKSYLVSQCYDISNLQNPTIQFDMAFDFENNWDLLYMQYSTNGGSSWSVLGSATDPTWYNSSRLPDGTDCFNCVGAQWTGEGTLTNPLGGVNADRHHYSLSLANFGFGGATPQTNMVFRFVFQSDQQVQNEGAIIDNFVITGTPALSNQNYNFDTFSVTPNPSNGNVTIKLNTSDKVVLSLFDIRGRSVYHNQYENTAAFFSQDVAFGNLEKGVYLLQVATEGKIASKKIVIE